MTEPSCIIAAVEDSIWDAGYQMTHSHEDLLFFTHNHFLIQLDAEGALRVFFNREVEEERTPLLRKLTGVLGKKGLSLRRAGSYELAAQPHGQLEIKFYEPVQV